MRNGREEKWCGKHGYWTWNPGAHTSEECTMRAENANVARLETKMESSKSDEAPKEASKSILKNGQDSLENKREKSVRFGSGFVSHVQNFV
jgi:hypothetical protein